MRIPCDIVKDQFGHAAQINILTRFICPKYNIDHHVTFLVDTGTSISFIGEADALKFSIDYNSLTPWPKKDWGKGLTLTPVYQLDGTCEIVFPTDHVEHLERFHVTKIPTNSENHGALVNNSRSLLGMDLISKLNLTVMNNSAYFEPAT